MQIASLLLAGIVAIVGCKRGATHGNPRRAAIREVVEIHRAEEAFHAAHGRFAALQELGRSASTGSNYMFEVVPGGEGYVVVAKTRRWNPDGRRSFFSEESRVIRESWTESWQASRDSPAVR